MFARAVQELYAYGDEATRRVLTTAANLTNEQWAAPGQGAQPSIRDTLVHLVGAQRSWLASRDGTMPAIESIARKLDPTAYPTAVALLPEFEAVHERTIRFVDSLDDGSMERVDEV